MYLLSMTLCLKFESEKCTKAEMKPTVHVHRFVILDIAETAVP